MLRLLLLLFGRRRLARVVVSRGLPADAARLTADRRDVGRASRRVSVPAGDRASEAARGGGARHVPRIGRTVAPMLGEHSPSPTSSASSTPTAEGPHEHRSPLVESALTVAVVAAKAAILGFAIDAFVNHDSPRLRGKAIRIRALGFASATLLVPLAWRLLPGRTRYPRGLDLAISMPLLLDAGGNAFGLYDEAHIDDVVHVANSAIISGRRERGGTVCGRAMACRGRRGRRFDRRRERLGDHGVRRDAPRRQGHGPVVRRHDRRTWPTGSSEPSSGPCSR